MKVRSTLLLLPLLLLFLTTGISAQTEDSSPDAPQTGVLLRGDGTFDGLTLFAPLISQYVYLINLDGQVVKSWNFEADVATSQEPYLLPNGNLLVQTGANSVMLPQFGQVGGVAGGLKEYTWDGSLVWRYDYAGDTYQQHHDIELMPNGNILLVAWEVISANEALSLGIRPDRIPEGGTIWPDHVAELNPQTNEIVWMWRVWDHLIQDTDPNLPNYGVIAEHPERIDINYVGPQQQLGDWQHVNSIDYNPQLDQIMLSLRNFSEIWIIDHSTTTREASSNAGGNSGMGGDLLYRWGNPAVYQGGAVEDQTLFYQHDAQWIDPGLPGAGNILIFNNGDDTRDDRRFSTTLEITPPLLENNTYARDGGAYAASGIVWEYRANPPESFFAAFVSGVQRLPNGNTLIVNGTEGRFIEVNPAGDLVWNYLNSYTGSMPEGIAYFSPTSVFRARRYPLNYPGLAPLFNS
ncbi:MAG: aryl-sulfate sulfotransferase [Anaerolineae bacterium]|nr:aryl-sulfate sulfotransferase [Anaerolineae bacterium]